MPPPSYRPIDYYRRVAPVLAVHLAGHRVREVVLSPAPSPPPSPARPATEDAQTLLARLEHEPVGFLTDPRGLVAIHLVPGDGADSATAATATLHLAEQCAADGLAPVALTDGAAGLWIMARGAADAGAAATRYTEVLTVTAPELATADTGGADGRCLVTVPVPGQGLVPLPYTALAHQGGWGAVLPLHLDEIAAVAAGMPAEFDPADAGDRLDARGDLAAGLLVRSPA